MRILLRLLASAVALAVATAVVPGIELQTASLGSKTLTLIGVALIFGVINALLKPIVKIARLCVLRAHALDRPWRGHRPPERGYS